MNKEKKQKRDQRAPEKINETLSYTVEVTDKDGRVLKRISAPSRSYVEQWNQLINYHASQTAQLVRDTAGVERSSSNGWLDTLKANAGIGVISYGIRIGKGTTAVAIDDCALETPCGEGVGVDEFSHQAMMFTAPAVVANTCSFTLRRSMVNNSGATIIGIKELGCYVWFWATATRYALGFRDVLGSPVDVPDGGAITVKYTIGVTA